MHAYLLSLWIVLVSLVGCFATVFDTPDEWTMWETGKTVTIQVKDGCSTASSLQLVNNGGFLPKNMGFIAKDVPLEHKRTYTFKVWDELPSSKTYQLVFSPNINSGNATTAVSPFFAIRQRSNHNDEL